MYLRARTLASTFGWSFSGALAQIGVAEPLPVIYRKGMVASVLTHPGGEAALEDLLRPEAAAPGVEPEQRFLVWTFP